LGWLFYFTSNVIILNMYHTDHSEITPLYPVLADQLLAEGKTAEAVALCEKGIAAFPRYITGYVVAAKAYLQCARFEDARAMCKLGLSISPHSAALKAVLEQTLQNIQTQTIGFPADSSNTSNVEDLNVSKETDSLQLLAEALKHAKIPKTDAAHTPLAESVEDNSAHESSGFANETMAYIYELQGAYHEAISAYTALAAQTPAKRELYNKKIEALRLKWNASKK